MDLQSAYRHMEVSHLAIDEVEHELLIRNLLFHFDDHESVKRRKLKDRMKEERSVGINATAFARTWRTAKEEISIIRSRIQVIRGIFENPKADARQREKLRTRVVHYRVRIGQLARAIDARKFLAEINEIENQIDEIIATHFPSSNSKTDTSKIRPLGEKLTEVLDEVRTEIATLNDTVATLEGGDDGGELDQTSGGAMSVLAQKKSEMELSRKRTEEILGKLNEYEPGKEKEFEYLIAAFKDFVVHTSEQQRLKREQEIRKEQENLKEMGNRIKRKQNLERLLTELNENMNQSEVVFSGFTEGTKETPHSNSESESQETIKKNKIKIGSNTVASSTAGNSKSGNKVEFHRETEHSMESAIEESESSMISKKKDIRMKGKMKNSRKDIRKKKKKHVSSTSSEKTLSSDFSQSTEFSSSSSSMDSSEEESRGKKRSKKKHKKTRKAIKGYL
ncbi:reticulocyte-binding protein homolog 2a-like [Armigeres subalbatus]|uniref:reticulocyte-binding protein homolog 2a-like n=1 Tax=Armigeres subalbatus TaxID=124917 RepID=UPI002ED121FA